MFASISKYHCKSIQSDNVLFDIAEKTQTCYLLPRSQRTTGWKGRNRYLQLFILSHALGSSQGFLKFSTNTTVLKRRHQSWPNRVFSHLSLYYRFFVQSGRCTEKHVAATVQENISKCIEGTKFQNSVVGSFFNDFDPKAWRDLPVVGLELVTGMDFCNWQIPTNSRQRMSMFFETWCDCDGFHIDLVKEHPD